jgi:hypothetical protein
MAAPLVESLSVTVWTETKVPPPGEITGVAIGFRLIVNDAFAGALAPKPGATAMALRVSDFATVIGSLQIGDEVVGVLPSSVQYKTAPAVASPTVTVCELLNEPPAGVNVGVAVAAPLDELLPEHPAINPSSASVPAIVAHRIAAQELRCHSVISENRGTMPPFVADQFL